MKAIILAGGLGTRISEETAVRPKPMVEIGGKPILWLQRRCIIVLIEGTAALIKLLSLKFGEK